MTARTPDDLLDAFAADGNKLIGPRPTRYIGKFDMVWKGGGSVIELEEDVTFQTLKLAFSDGGGTIRIEKGVTVKGRLEVNGGGVIRIGAGTFLNRVCDIRGGEGAVVDIGKNCLFSNVKVMTSDMHSMLDITTGKRTNPAAGIVIEDEVWVAEDVKIAKGVRIGTGSVIGAGSLVTRSIAPLSVAAGRPAKVLRSGVRWTRSLKKMPPLPAPNFHASEIPLEKEILRLLVERKQFALVEAVISSSELDPLPLYARWYLVLARFKLGHRDSHAYAMLDAIITEAPTHIAAQKLRATLTQR